MAIDFRSTQSLLGLKDYEVAKLLISTMPKGTFTSILVTKTKYKFTGQGEQDARQIQLVRSSIGVSFECVTAFFLQLFVASRAANRYGDNATLNLNLVAEYITKQSDLDAETIKEAKKDIKILFNKCETFTMYISDDCNLVEAVSPQANQHLTSSRGAAIFLTSIPKLIQMLLSKPKTEQA